MAVYDADGAVLNAVYDASGTLLNSAYDADGTLIYQSGDVPWIDEITVQTLRDTATNTNYYVIRIPQTRTNGNKQYPFVYAPNGAEAGTQSTLSMNLEKGFEMAINAGIFYSGDLPIGVVIENSELIQQGNTTAYALTVDDEGTLNYAQPNADGQTMISNGIVSAVVGFCPIVVNGTGVSSDIYTVVTNYNQSAQRQIIGQYSNGDYAIVTCEGRNFDNSTGWTIPQAISICTALGLSFAYNLDGGGSTETVIGNEQLNTIYEGTYGRVVPTYIVFNGTDTFGIPNAS